MQTIVDQMDQCIQDGMHFELVFVLESNGSTPRKAGANMIVKEDGSIFGTIGGGSLEYEAIKKGIELLRAKQNCIYHYSLSNNDAASIGMVCGGNTTLYFMYVDAYDKTIQTSIEYYQALKKAHQPCFIQMSISEDAMNHFEIVKGTINSCYLEKESGTYIYKQPLIDSGKVYIFGGGHISRSLVPLLQTVGFDCVVVESEATFLKDENFPTLKEKVICPFEAIDTKIPFSNHDYVVIMTRGHLYDAIVLGQVLKHQLTYIGMIGSKTKIRATYDRLKETHHYLEEDFKQVHAPIGIKIGGETPEEIAISIAAELIQVRHNKEKEDRL